jgi:hypothetical protein
LLISCHNTFFTLAVKIISSQIITFDLSDLKSISGVFTLSQANVTKYLIPESAVVTFSSLLSLITATK